MKFFIFLTALLFGLQTFSQDRQGYYIDNTGKRTDGYFKNTNFNNPENLEFKPTGAGIYESLSPEAISEYGIGEGYVFKKFEVAIDETIGAHSRTSTHKSPDLVKKTVFLEKVLESDASLYSYNNGAGLQFFFSIASKNIPITQLIYKKYYVSGVSEAENNQYIQQLFNDVNCKNEQITSFLKIEYTRKNLTTAFQEYNTCAGHKVTLFQGETLNKTKFKYTAFAGTAKTTVGTNAPLGNDLTKQTVSGGAEIALVLPGSGWSFFTKGEYEQFSGTTEYYSMDYKLFNFHLGPSVMSHIN